MEWVSLVLSLETEEGFLKTVFFFEAQDDIKHIINKESTIIRIYINDKRYLTSNSFKS